MRNVFFVLILANLAFAAWHAWFSGPDFPTQAIRSDAPAIELFASASDSSVSERTASATTPVDSQSLLSACLSVGPFPNRVDVQDAVGVLAEAGFNVDQRTAQGEVWLGYWVYLDAIETQAEAAAMVVQLAESGIDEAYVIADADDGNIVSLGVFSERARAQQRFSDAEELGMTPVVTNRSQPGEVFWLDVTADNGRQFERAELPDISVDPEPQFADCVE